MNISLAIPTIDPVATVREYINAFNKGDSKAMAACFAVPGSILDGLAPHVWRGHAACENWYRDVLVAAEHEGATDYAVTIGTPLHVNVTGDNAYLVIPASMTFKIRDKQVTQSGATFTIALRRHEDGWRISAWAWAKGNPVAS
jgi:ketosteroid isomerase-like protein